MQSLFVWLVSFCFDPFPADAPILMSSEEEWEKELEAELQDYEVVAENDKKGTYQQWENQIEEMLDAEELTDLK